MKFIEHIYIFLQSAFSLLPISKQKIMFIGYYGSQYGCSPKYLSQMITQLHPDWDVIWAFVDPSKHNIPHIRKVKYLSLRFFYELATSRVLITNYRMPEYYIKRRGQYYLMTWHSSLRLKAIEADVEESLPPHYIAMAKADSKKIDTLLSGCRYSDEIFRRAFWYDGEILSSGTPRIDVLLSESGKCLIQPLKKSLGVDGYNILLYAPTFRKNNSCQCYNLDFDKIVNLLQSISGKPWKVLMRLHPHMINQSAELINSDCMIDVTAYDDIQELLMISDMLITDYSSLMFDFAETKRPCLLYTPDINEYQHDDRKLYFRIQDLPFPACLTQDELMKEISHFDTDTYVKNIERFVRTIGSYEDGHSCSRVISHIEKWINQKK